MGYYIDLVFDPETPLTRDIVIARLKQAGAVERADEPGLPDGHNYDRLLRLCPGVAVEGNETHPQINRRTAECGLLFSIRG